MPQYKLTYFDIRARGEAIRLAFAYAKVPYEDCRVKFGGEEWAKQKQSEYVF